MTKAINELRPYPILKKNTRGYGRWFRIENPVTPGLPDALYIAKGGLHRWFEFKALKWAANAKVWKLTNLRPGQKARIHELLNCGATVYFVLTCGSDWYILRAADVLKQTEFTSLELPIKAVHWERACEVHDREG